MALCAVIALLLFLMFIHYMRWNIQITFHSVCVLLLTCFAALIWLQLGFMLLALIWKFDFPPFMVLIIAILNDGSWFLSSSKTPPIFVQVHIACTYNDF